MAALRIRPAKIRGREGQARSKEGACPRAPFAPEGCGGLSRALAMMLPLLSDPASPARSAGHAPPAPHIPAAPSARQQLRPPRRRPHPALPALLAAVGMLGGTASGPGAGLMSPISRPPRPAT